MNSRAKYLEVAEGIGSRFCTDALWWNSKCNWIGRSFDDVPAPPTPPGISRTVKALTPDIYEGTSGIAIFLADLYSFGARNENYRITAEGAINQAISNATSVPNISRFGYHAGAIGIAHAGIKIGKAFSVQPLIERSLGIIHNLEKNLQNEHLIDVISGNAGAIPALLDIYNITEDRIAWNLALQLGAELISLASKEEEKGCGWSWSFKLSGLDDAEHNLTGFSHGASGIGHSLLELFFKTGNEEFRNATELAFRYENHWFSEQHNNWLDFRSESQNYPGNNQELRYATAWCHGAPGIGLSRLRAYQILRERNYLNDYYAAHRTMTQVVREACNGTLSKDFTLCHGLSGIGQILLQAHKILNESSYWSQATEIGEYGIQKYHAQGIPWPCGIKKGEMLGLMIGLAGIGNFYLSLYDPENVFCPLILSCPKNSKVL